MAARAGFLRNRAERFFRARTGMAPRDGAAVLTSRRVFILPTGTGMAFGGLLLVMLAGAVNYGSSLAYALTFLLVGVALVAMLHAWRNLAGLAVRAGSVTAGFAGGRVDYAVTLTAPPGPARRGVRLDGADGAAAMAELAAGTATVTLTRPARRRGRLALGVVTLSSGFPLGLYRVWSRVELPAAALVYPRPAPPGRPWPAPPRTLSARGDQGRGGDDFRGFRSYHPGDSLRHVHWKAAAHGQELLTKEFGGDRAEELWLDFGALDGLDTEQRLSQLCRWVLEADRAGRPYGLQLPGRTRPPGRGPAHRERCLADLATWENRS